jgi:hypothetical protein
LINYEDLAHYCKTPRTIFWNYWYKDRAVGDRFKITYNKAGQEEYYIEQHAWIDYMVDNNENNTNV